MKINGIKSRDNDKIRLLKKLKMKKIRNKMSKFFIENFKIIGDGVNDGYIFESIFVTKEFFDKHKKDFNLMISKSSIKEIFLMNPKVNQAFSDLETPSGITAIYKKSVLNINENVSDYHNQIIYLNNINDPGNLGTIIRSALSFDIEKIVIDEGSVDLFNYKTINSAKDSIFKAKICFDNNTEKLKQIKNNMPVYVTSLKASQSIDFLDDKKDFCMVLGNEAQGVSLEIVRMADELIKIQMSSRMESLNVANSAAIIFHQIYNSRSNI